MRLDLSRRGDYAVRAMLALADPAAELPLSANRIAADTAVPERFLPHVLRDLARAGLVAARPGRTGGYVLARPAEAISLLSVIEAVEDPESGRCVLRGGPCGMDGRCAVHEVFATARESLRAHLAATTLADLTGRDRAPDTPSAPAHGLGSRLRPAAR